jgi:dihydrofolate reductase
VVDWKELNGQKPQVQKRHPGLPALIDELHLAIAPVLLGSGEHLLSGIDAAKLGYQCSEHVATANATHVVLTKRQ